jgi:hypothetical protein
MRSVKDGQADLLAKVEVGSPLRVGNVISFAEAADLLRRQIAVRKLRAIAQRRKPGTHGGGDAA